MRVYNTLNNQKEEFIPLREGAVSIYCCGPTTYNYIHLGNARPLVVFDTMRRYFIWRGYNVTYIQNFTDVDDKIINRAGSEGISPQAVAEKYIAAYFEDASQLNVLKADIHPRVTEHIPDIIDLIKNIIARGHAYTA
ncbi:MAG: class I tRNA ligase family protein, partial [Clostridia bacterium]|nr:class I tRNA ligase family protein [Clostridia bacterium]